MPDQAPTKAEARAAFIEQFKRTAHDPQARAEFAESFANIVLPELETQSSVRAIFEPTYLEPGANPVFPIPFEDTEITMAMPQVGTWETTQVEGNERRIDTHGVMGGIEYQWEMAQDGRIDVAELAMRLFKARFLRREEATGWLVVQNHAAGLPSAQKLQAFKADGTQGAAGTGIFNIYTIVELMTLAAELGIGGRRVTDIYMSPRRAKDLLLNVAHEKLPESWRQSMWNASGSVMTQDTQKNPFNDIRFHVIHNPNIVPDNKAYAFTQKDGFTYGKMAIREDLQSYDDPASFREFKIGVLGRARYGFAAFDSRGLIEITF